MRTIVLATQKGGSGKSTLAIGIAVAAMGDGHRVAIVETDHQGTVSNWGRRRTSVEPHIVCVGNTVEIERALSVLKHDGFELVIIDTPATNNMFAATAIRLADLCLIPARPSPTDIEAAVPTIDVVRKLGKPFAFVLNQAPPRGYRQSEAAAALNATGMLALPYIVQRNDHQDALGAGFGVTEFAPDEKAALEILALWRWVWQRLAVGPSDHEQAPIRVAG